MAKVMDAVDGWMNQQMDAGVVCHWVGDQAVVVSVRTVGNNGMMMLPRGVVSVGWIGSCCCCC